MYGVVATDEQAQAVERFVDWLHHEGYAIGYQEDGYTVLLDDPGDESAVADIINEYLRHGNC
jgi:hypothetical protein